jgi:hypothetical protein
MERPLPSHPKVCCGGASGSKAAPGDGEDGARPEDDDRGASGLGEGSSEGIEEDGGDGIGGWRRRWEGARGEEDVGGG